MIIMMMMTMMMMTTTTTTMMMSHVMNRCSSANIPCVMVHGIAKGYGHDPEDVYTASSETNHAWNLVLVQGEWRPLDSTWGAGHLDRGGNFQRKFDEHWFLTDPEEFVPHHFPLHDGCVSCTPAAVVANLCWEIVTVHEKTRYSYIFF